MTDKVLDLQTEELLFSCYYFAILHILKSTLRSLLKTENKAISLQAVSPSSLATQCCFPALGPYAGSLLVWMGPAQAAAPAHPRTSQPPGMRSLGKATHALPRGRVAFLGHWLGWELPPRNMVTLGLLPKLATPGDKMLSSPAPTLNTADEWSGRTSLPPWSTTAKEELSSPECCVQAQPTLCHQSSYVHCLGVASSVPTLAWVAQSSSPRAPCPWH